MPFFPKAVPPMKIDPRANTQRRSPATMEMVREEINDQGVRHVIRHNVPYGTGFQDDHILVLRGQGWEMAQEFDARDADRRHAEEVARVEAAKPTPKKDK